MQNILLFAIYGRGLEPFGGAKTGELIASIDSPPKHSRKKRDPGSESFFWEKIEKLRQD